MFLRIWCRIFGHRRGVRVNTETVRCPRCDAHWSRKAKP